jgi:hypothetical protein
MHLKVFVKLKKTLKTLSSGQKTPKKNKKTQKTQKTQKNPKKPKKTHRAGFFLKKPGFFPTLPLSTNNFPIFPIFEDYTKDYYEAVILKTRKMTNKKKVFFVLNLTIS